MERFIEYFTRYLFMFGDALKMTLYLATMGILIGLVLGLALAFMKLSKFRPLRWITAIYINFVRGTPLLVQLFIIYYGGSHLTSLPAPMLASVGLGIHNGAYIAEIFRGGYTIHCNWAVGSSVFSWYVALSGYGENHTAAGSEKGNSPTRESIYHRR